MGIQINTEAFSDSDLEKKIANRKKIQKLSVVLILSIVARVFIKNPAPPKPVDYTTSGTFRAVPGVLRNLSESDKKKFTPQQLAMLAEADQKFALKKSGAAVNLSSDTKPSATKPNPEKPSSAFAAKPAEPQKWGTPKADPKKSDKNAVVVFRRGGVIRAESVTRSNSIVSIRVNRNMIFQIPALSVSRILENADNWMEPTPEGYLGLKK